ncbi:MAG: sigma-70 family RNA polymerase sigma factor [Gammaproteobacteria bacterium]|nr:sigma-70 family RNA polymerase sigma factor [Gammaproteobacteria bacterium]
MIKYGQGSIQAFELLYQRHKGASYRYFLRQCHDQTEAEDLMQELWGRVIKAKDKYRQQAQFNTWFYRIAHNLLVDHHKHLSVVNNIIKPSQSEAIDQRETNSPEPSLIHQKQALRLKECLTKLPKVQLETFLIKQESGLNIAEISGVVDASTEAIKSRLRYAIASLKQCIGGLS